MLALSPAEREVHRQMSERLLAAVSAREPHPDGYSFRIDTGELALVSQWIAHERKCCPFLGFELDVPSGSRTFSLRLRGPEGTRQLLEAELGISAPPV